MIHHPLLERVQVRSHAITNGTGLFCALPGLRQVEIETSSIETFDRFFQSCSALRSIPPLDTSGGRSFCAMFQGCSALRQLPPLDTSRGTDFNSMFAWLIENGGCLVSLPLLDTRKGVNFAGMFIGCSLRQIPALDCSALRGSIDFSYSRSLRRIAITGLGQGLSQQQGGGQDEQIVVTLEGCPLDAAALNAFYAALVPVNQRGFIYVHDTPGSQQPEHQPQLAAARGWLVYY